MFQVEQSGKCPYNSEMTEEVLKVSPSKCPFSGGMSVVPNKNNNAVTEQEPVSIDGYDAAKVAAKVWIDIFDLTRYTTFSHIFPTDLQS